MVTKIGKLIFTLLIYFNIYAQTVSMRLLTTNGIELASGAVGIPFMLEVVLKDDQENNLNQEIQVEGLNNFTIISRQIANYSSSVNGVRTSEKRFIYILKVDKAGLIKLGPAHIVNGQAKADPITIDIKDIKEVANQQSSGNNSTVRYDLKIKENEVFVGEKVDFTLQFSYPNGNIELKALQDPEIPNIKPQILTKPRAKNEIRNGVPYTTIEIQGCFYPDQPGELTIPALRANYTEWSNRRNSPHSFFRNFFAYLDEGKVAYSQPVTIKVNSLPPTNRPVNAIGEFKNFTATLNQNKASQGDAIVLSLSVEGQGNIEQLKAPDLALPKSFSYYKSKSALEPAEGGKIKKFEYIIQGLQAGNWAIEPQEFTYFEISTKSYKTLKSQPLNITIEPNSYYNQEQEEEKNEKRENLEANQSTENALDSLHDQVLEYQKEAKQLPILPLSVFLSLLLIPIIYLLILFLLKWYRKIYRKSFIQARKQIKRAYRKKNLSELYSIIKKALINKLNLNMEATDGDIIDSLKNIGVNKNILEQWHEFNNRLLACSKYNPNTPCDDNTLFDQALNWLNTFEKFDYKRSEKLVSNILILIFFPLLIKCQEHQDKLQKRALEDILLVQRIEKESWLPDYCKANMLINNIKSAVGAELNSSNNKNYNIVESLYRMITVIPDILWQIIFIIIWSSLIFFANLIKMRYKILLLILLTLIAFVGIIILYRRNMQHGIVNKQTVGVRIGPDKSYPFKSTLNYLDDIRILKKINDWYYISSHNGKGWINIENIEVI